MTTVVAEIDWKAYRAAVPKGTEPARTSPEWRIREDIIVSHLYLTKTVVAKMLKTLPSHVERDDLESWAKIGLMQAVLRFDETMSVPFAAFAAQRMRSCILDGIREQDWAPRSLRQKQRSVRKAEEVLKQQYSREPTAEEVAQELGVEASEVRQTKYKSSIATHTYLDNYTEDVIHTAVISPTENDLVAQLRSTLVASFLSLPVREATIIALYYFEKKKLSEIAKMLGVSEVKVGAMHSDAVTIIWNNLESVLAEES